MRRGFQKLVGDTLLRRLLVVYAAAVAVLAVVGGAVVIFAVWPHYEGLERRESQHRQNAVLQAVQSERDRLQDLANTYGVWDAPFDYVTGAPGSESFPETDLSPTALDQIEVDAVFIADNSGHVLFRGLSAEGPAPDGLLPLIEDAFAQAPGLRLAPDDDGKTAMLTFGGEVVLFSVRRILHSDGTGDSPGVIGLARIVGPDVLSRMSELTGVDFHVVVMERAAESGPHPAAPGVRSQAVLGDAWDRPIIRVDVLGAPEVLNLGRATIAMMVLTMLVLLVAIATGFAMLLAGAVVHPVTALIRDVGALSRGEKPAPAKQRPPKEIRALAAAFADAFATSREEAALHRAAHRDAMAARAAAERANQAKSRFLATMSHELRTPLNAIIGYSEMMQEEAVAGGRAEDAADFDRILSAARGLLGLINSILDFSRLESGHLSVQAEPFDVARLVRETAELVRPGIDAKGVQFIVTVDGELGEATTDATRLAQCMTNLLSNAAKFTEGGEISFRAARRRESDGDWLLFAIEDTGIGMTEEQVKRVFEPFVQADDTISRRFGGTGLGLSITKDLVRRLGGRIGVRSSPGVGTRFVVRIPAVLPEAAAANAKRAA